MRICYVADGASIHTQRWLNYFAQKGHEVHLICWKVMPGYDDSIRIHLLTRLAPKIWAASQYLSFLFWIIQVRRLIRRIKPDIVDGHFITVYGFLAACSGFHPLVVSAWGSDVLIVPNQNPFYRFLTTHALKKADLITSDAEHLVEKLIKLGARREKIELVYFGVDTQIFYPKQRDAKLREELAMFDSPTIISARNLKPLYDVATLVKAVPLVLAEIPDAKFIIASDGDQRGYLEELTSSLGLSNSVRFVGWLRESELSDYFTASDIYVSTSLSDAGLAASTAEAMACGLPVIITDFGDNRKWVQDGKNGFIVPVKNPEALASKIVYLLQNMDDRIKFGQANQQLIEEKNNREREMERVERFYKELIERCKR